MADVDTYGQALKNVINRDPDQQKAKEFMQGYDQPVTLQEGYDNLKNEVGSWFGKKKEGT